MENAKKEVPQLPVEEAIYATLRASYKLSRLLEEGDQALAGVNEWLLLRSLDGGEPIALAKLARSLGVGRNLLGRQLDAMAKQGLVSLEVVDKAGKSQPVVARLAAGEELLGAMDARVAARLEGRVNPAQLSRVVFGLRKLVSALNGKDKAKSEGKQKLKGKRKPAAE